MDTHFHFTIIGFNAEDRISQIMEIMKHVEPALFENVTTVAATQQQQPLAQPHHVPQPQQPLAQPNHVPQPQLAPAPQQAQGPPAEAAQGLPAALQGVPETQGANGCLQCAICFIPNPPMRMPCGHGMCAGCQARWFNNHHVCPDPYCQRPCEAQQVTTVKTE